MGWLERLRHPKPTVVFDEEKERDKLRAAKERLRRLDLKADIIERRASK